MLRSAKLLSNFPTDRKLEMLKLFLRNSIKNSSLKRQLFSYTEVLVKNKDICVSIKTYRLRPYFSLWASEGGEKCPTPTILVLKEKVKK